MSALTQIQEIVRQTKPETCANDETVAFKMSNQIEDENIRLIMQWSLREFFFAIRNPDWYSLEYVNLQKKFILSAPNWAFEEIV